MIRDHEEQREAYVSVLHRLEEAEDLANDAQFDDVGDKIEVQNPELLALALSNIALAGAVLCLMDLLDVRTRT